MYALIINIVLFIADILMAIGLIKLPRRPFRTDDVVIACYQTAIEYGQSLEQYEAYVGERLNREARQGVARYIAKRMVRAHIVAWFWRHGIKCDVLDIRRRYNAV
jgi:hypothetical protein